MLAVDADALICDMAEIYHVYDFRRLPLRTAAVFAQGLPENSRIMRRLTGAQADRDTLLLAAIADRLSLIAWMLTEDGGKGRNRPRPILDAILGRDDEKAPRGFETAADFTAAWENLTGGS